MKSNHLHHVTRCHLDQLNDILRVSLATASQQSPPNAEAANQTCKMGPRISDEKLNSIVDQLKQGVKPLVIAQNVECHLATVYRIDRNLKFFDSPRAPPAIRGRPKKITTDILEDIQEYCEGREFDPPGLAELAEFVTAKYGFSISQSSMSRAMKELGLVPKEVSGFLQRNWI